MDIRKSRKMNICITYKDGATICSGWSSIELTQIATKNIGKAKPKTAEEIWEKIEHIWRSKQTKTHRFHNMRLAILELIRLDQEFLLPGKHGDENTKQTKGKKARGR